VLKKLAARWAIGVVVVGALGLLAWGCADTSAGECGTRDDCAASQVCRDKVCVAPAIDGSCTDHNECPTGEFCVSRLCVSAEDNNATNNGVNNTANNGNNPTNNGVNNPTNNGNNPTNNGNNPTNNGNNPTNNGNNGGPDQTPPRITSFFPNEGAMAVATDVTIRMEFSETVREFGLSSKISLKVADTLEEVPLTITYAQTVITAQPTTALRPGTPYVVDVSNEITDLAGNKLPDQVFWFFATAVAVNPTEQELAMTFAPVVYQEVDPDTNLAVGDYFTKVDFDTDWDATNNYTRYRANGLAGAAYYNVIETESHYFIQYLFYYPVAYESQSRQFIPHDVTAVVVVVKKGTPPTFVMAESGYGPNSTQYFGFAVDGNGTTDRNVGNLEVTFTADTMWNTSHYRAYHGKNTHGSCHWDWAGSSLNSPWCTHTAGQFRNNATSVVYYPFTTGSGYRDLACTVDGDCNAQVGLTCQEGFCKDAGGHRGLTYELVDLRSTLWLRRFNIGAGDNVFSGTTVYAPHVNSGGRPGLNEGRIFPSALAATGSEHRGAMPFVWQSPGSVSTGQWWVDPAYTILERFRFETPDADFSLNYCSNVYFGVDQRGQGACQ